MALGCAGHDPAGAPEAAAITARALAEIARLEDIFSLYQTNSALSQLNAAAVLNAPPPELLECLTLAGSVHRATEGLFDPTVQPLWALWATSATAGTRPTKAELTATRVAGGWDDLRLDAGQISMAPGMALTLNGIAQGYIADRVARCCCG